MKVEAPEFLLIRLKLQHFDRTTHLWDVKFTVHDSTLRQERNHIVSGKYMSTTGRVL